MDGYAIRISGWGIDARGEKRARRMNRYVPALALVLAAFGAACDDEPASSGASPPPVTTPAVETPTRDPSLEAFVGVDLAKAVKRLERRGYNVDLSRLSRGARIYATGLATHPMVVVAELDVQDRTVVVLRAECPKKRPC